MSNLYQRLHGVASRLIKKYGYNKVLYRRQVAIASGWKNQFDVEELEVDIIVLPSSKYSKETYRLQNEKAMVDNNYIAYMPYTNFIPEINDTFVAGGVTHTVMSIVRINPNGTDILFKLELK